VSVHEKLLKKVEQDRSKGQLERALTRLKEAIAQNPRSFELSREAAELCFGLGRTLEGTNILRAVMKRAPSERPIALELLEREFATNKLPELAETLYDSYLALPDYDRARDVVLALAAGERTKLLAKLHGKVLAATQEAPEDIPRLVGLLLAESLALSAMERSTEVAATLTHLLDLDATQTDTVGRLCKLELRQSPNCPEVQLLLSRCYIQVQKPELAVEHLVGAGQDVGLRKQALQLAETAGSSPAMVRVRAELLLSEGQYGPAATALMAHLQADEQSAAAVRHVLESVPGATSATPALQLLYARVLARTGAARLAMKELSEVRGKGADGTAALAIVDELLAADARSVDLHLCKARWSLESGIVTTAVEAFQQVIALDPDRTEKLREEIEAACKVNSDPELSRFLVDLYVKLELPQEASDALHRLRAANAVQPAVLFDLASTVAGQYGLSSTLLAVFVEAALDTGREREARAAVSHYLASPGVRTGEFAQRAGDLARTRPEHAVALGRVLDGLPLPVELRFSMALASLQSDDSARALVDIEAMVLERPAMRDAALGALDARLSRRATDVEAHLLAVTLCEEAGRLTDAAQRLARALRAVPAETDRICKSAESVLRRNPKQADSWREILLALVDVQRFRHARELCYLAAQALPPEQQGFVHVALAEMQLDSKQPQNALNEFESALACDDVPVDRIVPRLRQLVEDDAKHGYARFVLAAALLRQGENVDDAIAHLTAAVQQDDLLMDLAFDLLSEHVPQLQDHAAACVLEGTLRLRKGERARGVLLLGRAVELQPHVAADVLPQLETEWDRDSNDLDIGLVFAHAVRCNGQTRRAARLLGELARRFPDEQPRLIAELLTVVETEQIPEAHRVLWELFAERGDNELAMHHLQMALDAVQDDAEATRELLDAAQRRSPGTPWIVSRLAEIESRGGHGQRSEELLRSLLQSDPGCWETVLAGVRSTGSQAMTQGLHLLEIDCLLAGRRGGEALDALRRYRSTYPSARAMVVERYRLLVAQEGGSVAVELDLAVLLKEIGEISEAVTLLEAVVRRSTNSTTAVGGEDPVERKVRLALATLYVELGREREGRELLGTVLDRPGDHQETYGFLEKLAAQGMMAKLKGLRETIAASPGNLRARLELARLSIVAMDFEGAREVLCFTGDSPAVEAARLYLLARSHYDEDQPQLALAVLRSVQLDDVAEQELRRNIVYLKAVCCERLGNFSEAHALFLQLLSEVPYFKDTRERVRATYKKHLEAALETRVEALEKRTHLEMM